MEKLNFDFNFEDDSELIEKMKRAYEGCPAAVKYCKELGIPDELIERYMSRVYDFVCDINYCKHCPGIKKCAKENPLLISKIEYVNGTIETVMSPCRELIKRVAFEKQFLIRDFSDEWLDTTLKDLNTSLPRKEALKQYVAYIKGKDYNWIYLNGNGGTGKSFFAAAMVIDAATRNLGPICFLNSAKRIRELSELSSKKNTEEFQKQLDMYCNARILVLDDFGNEFVNDYIRDTIIYPILNERDNKKLLTIFTSDFKIDEIETLYSTSKAGQLRARQISRILKSNAKKEIYLGDISIY